MRRLKPQEKKRVGEFRWIRGVDEALNFGRFMKHVERLKRKFRRDGGMGKYTLRNRRSRRVARLAQARRLGVEQLLQRCTHPDPCSIAVHSDEIPSPLVAGTAVAANDE